MTRDELVMLIRARKEEAARSKPKHKRDIHKNIKRLERELRDYDRFQSDERRCGVEQG